MSDVEVRGGGATEPAAGGDTSLGDLLGDVTRDFSDLVRSHVELAKAEIAQEVRQAGRGAGMLTGAALAAYLTLTLLSFAAAWGLSEVIPEGVAFLVVGVAWAIVTGILALTGKKNLDQVSAPPPQTTQTIQEDLQWAKQQAT
jgi:tetrahydromethanopterin S-methyltransferase subunit G